MKKEVIGNQTLYCGNSLEIMDLLADTSFDLVLTDPPYMINTKSDGTGIEINEKYFDTACRRVEGVACTG